jgi:assimilatory nitrate reductase catalytic subunit
MTHPPHFQTDCPPSARELLEIFSVTQHIILKTLLNQHTDSFTRDFVQKPGRFGLAKAPSRLKPVATVTSICGYCATGCQLKIHFDEAGAAINLTPQSG